MWAAARALIWRLIEETLGLNAGGQVLGRLRFEGTLIEGKATGRELCSARLLWQTLCPVCVVSGRTSRRKNGVNHPSLQTGTEALLMDVFAQIT